VGDEVEVTVVDVDARKRQIQLSMKEANTVEDERGRAGTDVDGTGFPTSSHHCSPAPRERPESTAR